MAIWESLMLTALGGVIGLAGIWLGARVQAREADRVRREQFEREDRFRLHKERIAAYSEFYAATGRMRRLLKGHQDLSLCREHRSVLWLAYTTVLLIGDRSVLGAATAILGWADSIIANEKTYDEKEYTDMIHRFQNVGRADLTGATDLP